MNRNTLLESHKNIVLNYIRAKDENKPHLMKAAFENSATLEMKVKTENISFPSKSVGLDEITNVLVRNFNQTYENIYTFCLTDSLKSEDNVLSCDWLVGMNEREGGEIRVGCGKYDWRFDKEKNKLTNDLVITIEQMLVFTPEYSNKIMEWLGKLPYPFCDSEIVLEFMPNHELLKLIRKYI